MAKNYVNVPVFACWPHHVVQIGADERNCHTQTSHEVVDCSRTELQDMLYEAGFPLIREIRENFENFFQLGKSGKNRGFSPKSGEKCSNQGTFFQNHFQMF